MLAVSNRKHCSSPPSNADHMHGPHDAVHGSQLGGAFYRRDSDRLQELSDL